MMLMMTSLTKNIRIQTLKSPRAVTRREKGNYLWLSDKGRNHAIQLMTSLKFPIISAILLFEKAELCFNISEITAITDLV